MNKKRQKAWHEMTTAELREATKQYDEAFAADREARPLTAAQRRLHQRAARRGRPRVGEGAAKILVSVERGLLRKADAMAEQEGISRSELIARGLKAVLGPAA